MKKILCTLLTLALLLSACPVLAEEAEHEPVTITFGGWGDIVLLHEQVEKFEEKYPWITVDIVKPAGQDWYAGELTQLAAEGNMPDVFNIENPLQAMSNGWCYDMTELFRNDPDSAVYPQEFLKYGVVDNQLVGLIGAMYAYGIELNLTLLEELNIPIPDYDWTIDEWADILRKTTVSGTSWGTINLTEMFGFLMPQFDPTKNCYGLDVDTFTFPKTDAMVNCLALFQDLMDDNVGLEAYLSKLYAPSWAADEEQTAARNEFMMENLGASDNLWLRGLIAMRINGSWNMNWPANNPELYSGFEWDWYPLPSAQEGEMGRTALLNEFLAMSATTEHPEEAYLLLKYMSYDMDGYEAKVDFMVNYDRDAMIAKYPEIDTRYVPGTIMIWLLGASTEQRADDIFAKMAVDKMGGLAAAFANRNNNSFLMPDRYVPNYGSASSAIDGAFCTDFTTGVMDAGSLADAIEDYCTGVVQEAYNAYGHTYGYTTEE